MCGIAGIINARLSRDDLESRMRYFECELQHRGPDDCGHFISKNGLTGLASTRLAIQDLSPAGHQPMTTEDSRYTIVFNGEIYNFKDLRAELETDGEKFNSGSDTEVILRMYARYGPDCVREFAGMFTIAIWDDLQQECFIARGALGIKPLYYFENEGALVFASEVRALVRSGLTPRRLCPAAVKGYLSFGAVPEPLTLIDNVHALSAGHYMVWRAGKTRITKFWDLEFGEEFTSRNDAVDSVREALIDSITRHLVSDVPVGVFLSGGVDSTTVVALASRSMREPLRTFCISFDNPEFNEGDIAARTAKHFGTQHSDWRLDSATAKSLLPSFLEKSDQPSIDGFNTFCVSKLAHDHGVKVVLSGLGGDELFGGYRSFHIVPLMVRASRFLDPIKTGVGELLQQPFTSARTNRLGHFLTDLPITSAAYWAMRGIFTPKEVAQLLPRFGCTPENGDSQLSLFVPAQPTLKDEVSYLEIARYMRNQLLRDSDVMSMAWSLELRVPFVDVKLISTLQKIPARLRLAAHKRLLLSAVPEIPEWVRGRPKQGFAFPFKEWLTGEWGEIFQRIDRESPIPLKSWYRSWCLFALESFLAQNNIEISTKAAVSGLTG
jgi:asparagine synthase (glutamine-hydrolysing)